MPYVIISWGTLAWNAYSEEPIGNTYLVRGMVALAGLGGGCGLLLGCHCDGCVWSVKTGGYFEKMLSNIRFD